LAETVGTWFAGAEAMTTHHGEAKPPPREGEARTSQEARTAREREVRAPSKDERDGELYNLPFTD
jgi:hypothetical protein